MQKHGESLSVSPSDHVLPSPVSMIPVGSDPLRLVQGCVEKTFLTCIAPRGYLLTSPF